MAVPHRKTGRPRGRPAGSPNKVTARIRAAVAAFTESVTKEELRQMFDAAKKDDPGKALGVYLRALEYFTPKLASVSVGNNDGEVLVVELRERHLDTNSDFSPKAGVKEH